MKQHLFDDAIAPLLALDWQSFPPPEQRALFAQLTQIMLAMLKCDELPEGQVYRTNADRERRVAENEDKLKLLKAAQATVFTEWLDDDQFRELCCYFKMIVNIMDDDLRRQKTMAG